MGTPAPGNGGLEAPPLSTLRHRALCRTCQLPQSLGCADTSSAQRLCRLALRGYVRLRGMERHWDSSRAYTLFSFSALATSGIRSGTLLLVPSSTTHQEGSDGLTSSVEHLRVGSEDFEGRSTTLDLTLVSLAQVSTKGDAAVQIERSEKSFRP